MKVYLIILALIITTLINQKYLGNYAHVIIILSLLYIVFMEKNEIIEGFLRFGRKKCGKKCKKKRKKKKKAAAKKAAAAAKKAEIEAAAAAKKAEEEEAAERAAAAAAKKTEDRGCRCY